MNDSQILDWNMLSALALFPEKGEEIIWSGRPNLRARFPGNLLADFETLRIRLWALYYSFIFLFIHHGLDTRQIWPFVCVFATIMGIQVVPYVLDYLRINHTFYVVTNTRILLRPWRLFEKKNHILRYDDFQKTNVVIEDPITTDGTIYLMTGKDVGFWTYEIETGQRRHHPTLERVKNAEALAKMIEKFRLEKA